MGAPDYSYQARLVEDCRAGLDADGRVVLAAGCGAGKTRMACDIIEPYLRDGARVLVIAHGLCEIREQWRAVLESRGHRPAVLVGSSGDREAQLQLGLFRAFQGSAENAYDLIVIDEAHHFYFGQTIQSLVARNSGAKQLLLTASHGEFNRRGWPVVYMSQIELLEHGAIMDPLVELVETEEDFRDYLDSKGDLKRSYKWTRANLERDVRTILARAETSRKTMIACHNQEAARQVVARLKQGMPPHAVALSTTDYDPDGEGVQRFRTDRRCQFLVVVQRSILGFDMPQLSLIVDMTGSENVDRIFQLLGRCLRPFEGKRPTYLKLAPKAHVEWYGWVMNACMYLAVPENYRAYKSKWREIPIAVEPDEGPAASEEDGVPRVPRRKVKIPRYGDILLAIRTGSPQKWTTLNKVAALYRGVDPEGKKEQLKNLLAARRLRPSSGTVLGTALESYTYPMSSSYDPSFASEMRELDGGIFPLEPGWFGWSEKKVRAAASKCKHRSELYKRYPGAYNFAKKHIGLNDLMPNKLPRWDWGRAITAAGIYSSKSEFQAGSPSAYHWAQRTGQLGDIAKIMGWKDNQKHRKVRCKETGKTYPSVTAAARDTDIEGRRISDVVSGRKKSTAGYTFEYVDDDPAPSLSVERDWSRPEEDEAWKEL